MIKQIKNMNELVLDIESRLRQGDSSFSSSLKNKSGKSFKEVTDEILKSEAERLKNCIKFHIEDYYYGYEPTKYVRSYGLLNALLVGTKVHYQNGMTFIGLYFDEYLMESASVVTKKIGNYKLNINDGWEVGSDVSFANTYRFGWFKPGYHFIEKGICDFLQYNPYGLEVKRLN